jgi:hypothetical protein
VIGTDLRSVRVTDWTGTADVGVGPVQDDRRAPAAAPVSRVEVAVHDGVGQAALIEQLEPAQQRARRSDLGGAEVTGAGAVEQGQDLVG